LCSPLELRPVSSTCEMEGEFERLCKAIKDLSADSKSTNYKRRVLFAEGELFRISLEASPCSEEQKLKREAQFSELEGLLKTINLKIAKHFWYDTLDRWVCGMAGALWLLNCVIFLCPLVLLVMPLDAWLLKNGYLPSDLSIYENTQKFIANVMLIVSGADLVVKEGNNKPFKDSKCPLVCFSHGSMMDTFVMGSMIPMRQHTLAKKELFLAPFLNLLLITFGGIPIDRKDRNSAVVTIQRVMRDAASGNTCMMVAPEGTRSKSGHLLPFKKGPFYIWEDMGSNIIPVVLFGAYELCPPGMTVVDVYCYYVESNCSHSTILYML
jgi:1-acyl-sn-glycerol-3-phosphate acyltransferase